MPERFERKPERWAVDGCEQCGRSDTCELTTTGKLLPLWIDNDSGETVCERCKHIRSNIAVSGGGTPYTGRAGSQEDS